MGDTNRPSHAEPEAERLATPATVVTGARTVAATILAALAASEASLTLLLASLAVYWAGDILDGFVARILHCETRIGALLDIFSDRLCASAFYLGLAYLQPNLAAPIFVYLFTFVIIDCYLSIGFLAWPIRSPNYFYEVDRTIWAWNWSPIAKAANSALFALLLVITENVPICLAVSVLLLCLKSVSMYRLVKLGIPVPSRIPANVE